MVTSKCVYFTSVQIHLQQSQYGGERDLLFNYVTFGAQPFRREDGEKREKCRY